MMSCARWLGRGILLFCLLFVPHGVLAAGVQPEDFMMRGVAIGATESDVRSAFGAPDYDRDGMRWGIPLKTFTFPGAFEITLNRRTHCVVEMKTTSRDYVARAGVRYGATSYYLKKIYGKAERRYMEGRAYYVYENPHATHIRLLLETDVESGSLLSTCITALPLTKEEADAWQLEEDGQDLPAEESLTNLLVSQSDIDTSALPEQPEVRLGGLTN